ncbi:MAG: phenylalanine--tRNA ligase subunit beta [Brachymonas sp.]
MQFPESWLREFCNPAISTQELADALTMAGLEVEEMRTVAPPFSSVVIGEIKECVQHPNADRLRVCQVEAGQGALLNIVCGAPNARVGIRIPVALVGAELPPGEDGKAFQIKLGKLRGVESQGMLCSAKELKISEAAEGLYELAGDAPIGTNIRDYLKLDDTLLTLKLTPNLGHNLSVYGIAREVSAITGSPLLTPEIKPIAATLDDKLAVKISAPDLCGRFSGRIVRDVDTKAKTPQWMVDRLAACGQRSVTALVDISNYVMFEYGRPSHIFDLDKIHGSLDVRWAKPSETLKLLNGNTVTLDEKVGIIADDQAVESLAGIMGGDSTAVSDDTQNIYIEAAFWWPEAVAGRSRRFNFSTDAGHRFERGVDPMLTVAHIEHITRLVQEICGGQAAVMDDQQPNMPKPREVTLRVARASKIIGMPVTAAQCMDVFAKLGLPATQDGDVITVQPPVYRFDITLEEDLIEEVVRIIGFDSLPETAPLAPVEPKARSERSKGRFALRRTLASLGYLETINFSFVEERWERDLAGNHDPIKLLNPIASQLSVMRSSLLGSLLAVLKHNQDRKASRVRVFELGRVFARDASVKTAIEEHAQQVRGIAQPMRIAALAWGGAAQRQWSSKDIAVDFYDAKGDVEALLAPAKPEFKAFEHPAMHPGRCAQILLNGQAIGVVGELHPRWKQGYEITGAAPVLFELDVNAVMQRALPSAVAISKFQAVERDIAVVVKDSVSHAALMQAIHAAPTQGLLQDALLFDVFRAKEPSAALAADEKSLAIRLSLQDEGATLTDEQIDSAVAAVLDALAQSLGARLRS